MVRPIFFLQDLGTATGSVSATVRPHDVAALFLTPAGPLAAAAALPETGTVFSVYDYGARGDQLPAW